MQYREIHPPSHLRNIIRFFWTLEVDAVSSDAAGFRIVPDGCPGMMFWEEKPQLSLVAGKSSAVPHLFLYGQATRHGMLYSPDRADPLGVSFYPHALKIVFGFDADEFKDEIIDLLQPVLAEKLYNSRQTKERIGLLSSFISRQIVKHTSTSWFILNSIGRILDSKGISRSKTCTKRCNYWNVSFNRLLIRFAARTTSSFRMWLLITAMPTNRTLSGTSRNFQD